MRKPWGPPDKPAMPVLAPTEHPVGTSLIAVSERLDCLPSYHEDRQYWEEEWEDRGKPPLWKEDFSVDIKKVLKLIEKTSLSIDDFYITLDICEDYASFAVENKKPYPKNAKQLAEDKTRFNSDMKWYKSSMKQYEAMKVRYDEELLAYNKFEKERLEKEIKELEG
jgi:hypothetical protein